MFLLLLFISGCYATAVSDVTCNGRDAMSFVLTKNAGTIISKFTLTGCSGQNVDLPNDAYTVTGDQYSFDFNPYDQCVTTPVRDPNDASTYNVDITLLAIRGENIAGKDVIKGGDKVALSCQFQTNYQVESDLRTISLSGEELTGEEFRLAFVMDRTQSDYATPDDTEIETNQVVYHTIKATSPSQLDNTDFTFKPYQIRLQKKNDPDSFFDLFNVGMSTCGHEALNFQMTYTNGQYNFEYSQILLDTDLTAEYKLVADLKLCNSDAMSPECTAFDKCEESDSLSIAGPFYPVDNNVIKSAQPIWRNWVLQMNINTHEPFTVPTNGKVLIVRVKPTLYIEVYLNRVSSSSASVGFEWGCSAYSGLWHGSDELPWGDVETKSVRFEARIDPVSNLRDVKLFVNGIEKQFGHRRIDGQAGSGVDCPEDGVEVGQVYAGNPFRPLLASADVELTDVYFAQLQ